MASRQVLKNARRIIVKLGSAVVTRSNNDCSGIALGRTAGIVEQVSHLAACGREMIVVSSGAIAAGRQVFRTQNTTQQRTDPLPIPSRESLKFESASTPAHFAAEASDQESAAAGQARLMALYDAMFQVYGFSVAQVLVSIPDLMYDESRKATCETIKGLVQRGVIPIINENDVITCEPADGDGSITIDVSDNDTVSAVLARELQCDALLMLSNVPGVFTGDPSQQDSTMLNVITSKMLENGDVAFGAKSSMGRGGMESKVKAAAYAMEGGVATVIADGLEWRSVVDIIEGEAIGTLLSDE